MGRGIVVLGFWWVSGSMNICSDFVLCRAVLCYAGFKQRCGYGGRADGLARAEEGKLL